MINILQPQAIADRLNKSKRWVYDNASALGGVKIGGSWIFTQEGLDHAIMGQAERNLESAGKVQRAEISGQLRNQKRSNRMGGQQAKGTIRRSKEDDHNRHGLGNLL
jgi:hypothetical protein